MVGSLVNGTTYLFKVRAKGSGGIIGTESMVALAVPGAAVPATDFDSNDNNLIEISTLAQLHAMRFDPDGDGIPSDSVANKLLYHNAFKTSQVGPFCDACVGYELMNDLDFNTGEVTRSDDTYYNGGSGWLPIGTYANQFATTFNGNGYVIKNLSINRSGASLVGLFSNVASTAVLTGIALRDVSVTGGEGSAPLVGINFGAVRASYATGTVNSLDDYAAGLVGVNYGSVTASYSTAAVTGGDKSAGFVGNNMGSITNSYSTGAVGVAGASTGHAGFVGENTGGSITASYWDTQTSGQTASPGGGTGKTTLELQTPVEYGTTGIYRTWDADDIDGDTIADAPWDFGTNSEYPLLIFAVTRYRRSILKI